MEKQPKVTVETVIRAKKTLKELTPEQLIMLRDSSKKACPAETYQLITNEINRRLVGE